MLIGGLHKTSLIDYPGKISCVIFTQGCNFRCSYCYNPQLVEPKGEQIIDEQELFSFLLERKGFLDGVVICGGEPLLQPDIFDFISKIKQMNYSVKLDINGSFPSKLQKLIQAYLVDYISMDVKAPLEKYNEITNSNICPEEIKKSISLIIDSKIPHEFRTTVVKSLLSIDDILKIGKLIEGADLYILQKFVPTNEIIKKHINYLDNYTDSEFQQIVELVKRFCNLRCKVRNV